MHFHTSYILAYDVIFCGLNFSLILRGFIQTLCKFLTGDRPCPTVLFQTIQFSLSIQFSSIWPIDTILSGSTTPSQRVPGSDGCEEVLSIPQSSSITRASQFPYHLQLQKSTNSPVSRELKIMLLKKLFYLLYPIIWEVIFIFFLSRNFKKCFLLFSPVSEIAFAYYWTALQLYVALFLSGKFFFWLLHKAELIRN